MQRQIAPLSRSCRVLPHRQPQRRQHTRPPAAQQEDFVGDAAINTNAEEATDEANASSSSSMQPTRTDRKLDSGSDARIHRPQANPRPADSTDWVASTLTRRFGIAGGLAWLGVLSFGIISEQVKTRLEVAAEEAATRDVDEAQRNSVTTTDGITYTDLKIGGGALPQRGDLIVLDYKAYADGEKFEDTYARGKPIVFFSGSRPFAGGICLGVELALRTMKAGGKRVVDIPPELGFGEGGTALRPTEHVPEKQGIVPPGASLRYELELVRVSIPPS